MFYSDSVPGIINIITIGELGKEITIFQIKFTGSWSLIHWSLFFFRFSATICTLMTTFCHLSVRAKKKKKSSIMIFLFAFSQLHFSKQLELFLLLLTPRQNPMEHCSFISTASLWEAVRFLLIIKPSCLIALPVRFTSPLMMPLL